MKRGGREREYAKYLKSEHWLDTRLRYRASKLRQECWCGEAKVDLHHKTYERLGGESLTDLEPLCRKHHAEMHRSSIKYKQRQVKKKKTPASFTRTEVKLGRAWLEMYTELKRED